MQQHRDFLINYRVNCRQIMDTAPLC